MTVFPRWAMYWAGAMSLALLTGCASGPAFVALEAAASDRTAVYVYRTFALGGSAIGYPVAVNGRPAGTLQVSSFLRAETQPGATHATVTGPDCVSPQTVAITGSQIVFVEAVVEMSSLRSGGGYLIPDYRCRLVQRAEPEALKALSGLRKAQ